MEKSSLATDFYSIVHPFTYLLSVYLFGSTVAGIDREGSDVDIAVHLDENLPAEKIIELRFQLIDLFESYFKRPVDVVVLNSASLKLIPQVIKYGMLIYAREPERTREYTLRKRKEYFDFKYYIDKDINQMRTFFGC